MRVRAQSLVYVVSAVALVSGPGPGAVRAEPVGLEVAAEDPLDAAADQAYRDGVKSARAGRYAEALAKFEAALPRKAGESELFYNLVQMAKAKALWDKVALYATGFLLLSPTGADAEAFGRLMTEARERMRVRGTPLTKVALTVQPADAKVYLNDTPVSLASTELPTGSYTVRVEAPGFVTVQQSYKLGKDAPLSIALEKQVFMGKVVLAVTPPDGVAVFVDDEKKGELPAVAELELDSAKRYLVRFEKPGFDPWVRYVQPPPNGKVIVEAKLEQASLAPPVMKSKTP